MYLNRARKVYALLDELRSNRTNTGVTTGSSPKKKTVAKQRRLAKTRNVATKSVKLEDESIHGAGHVARSPARQERSFPSVTPDNPRVTLVWDRTLPDRLRQPLDHLLERVVRVGHSSSLVSCRIAPDPPEPTAVPGSLRGKLLRERSGWPAPRTGTTVQTTRGIRAPFVCHLSVFATKLPERLKAKCRSLLPEHRRRLDRIRVRP